MKAKVRKCLDCRAPVQGKATRCEKHRKERKLQTRRDYMKDKRKGYKGYKSAPQLDVKPYEPSPTVKTSLQFHEECRQEEQRLAEVKARLNPQLLSQRMLQGWVGGSLF